MKHSPLLPEWAELHLGHRCQVSILTQASTCQGTFTVGSMLPTMQLAHKTAIAPALYTAATRRKQTTNAWPWTGAVARLVRHRALHKVRCISDSMAANLHQV